MSARILKKIWSSPLLITQQNAIAAWPSKLILVVSLHLNSSLFLVIIFFYNFIHLPYFRSDWEAQLPHHGYWKFGAGGWTPKQRTLDTPPAACLQPGERCFEEEKGLTLPRWQDPNLRCFFAWMSYIFLAATLLFCNFCLCMNNLNFDLLLIEPFFVLCFLL